jgi:hypothetical protein
MEKPSNKSRCITMMSTSFLHLLHIWLHSCRTAGEHMRLELDPPTHSQVIYSAIGMVAASYYM